MRTSRHRRGHSLVRQADVAAVGFAVAAPSAQTRRLMIERESGGAWKVVDDSDLRDISENSMNQAVSMSAAIICGANLTGRLVTELEIDGAVRWVAVSRGENRGAHRSHR